jgi:hypothetical protein
MKRSGLILATVSALLFTGLVLHRAGWLTSRAAASTPGDGASCHAAGQLLTSQAGWRYRQSQPRHWRDCMLRH